MGVFRFHKNSHHSHGVRNIDFYASQSKIRHWNDSFKAASSCIILLLCMILDQPEVSIAVIATMGIVNIWANRVPALEYIGLLKVPLAFLAIGCVIIALGISKQPMGDYRIFLCGHYFYTTNEGAGRAAALFLKAMGAVSAMYVLTLSTSASELAGVLKKAHVPKAIVELMNMMYRFIFILTEVQGRMKTAAVSRLGYVDFKASCYSFGQIGGNLFLVSLKKANTYYDAMVSRGYEGDLPFWEEEKQVKLWQAGALVLYLCGLAGVYILATR